MAEPPASTLAPKKIQLGLTLVATLVVAAFFVFIVSAWGESHFDGGLVDDKKLVEYVVGDGVEVRLPGSSTWESLESDLTLESGIAFRTDADSEMGVFFRSADLFRLFSDTEVLFDAVDLTVSPVQIEATLVEGSVWLSDFQGVSDLQIETDRIRVEPVSASVYVNYSEVDTAPEVEVFAAHHPVRVSFLEGENGKRVLNDYLLTESHHVEIRESTLSTTLEQLQYTKLTKEYPFQFVDSDEWKDVWEMALEADENRLDEVALDFFVALRRQGLIGYEEGSLRDRLDGVFRALRSIFTLSDRHLMKVAEGDDIELIYQAMYLIDKGEIEAADDRLNRFVERGTEFSDLDKFNSIIQVMQGVLWGDDLYDVKEVVRDVRITAVSDDADAYFDLSLVFLRERLNEIYDLLDHGELSTAKAALLEYNSEWQTIIASRSSQELSDKVQRLTEERQILQNLLYREDTFYQIESYEVLWELEDRILNLTAEEYNLNEERQAFVQDKIRILNRLVDLVDSGDVGIDEGVDLAYEILGDTQDMLGDITSQTAIMDYFVAELAELSLKFEFINSSDYLLETGPFDIKFESYLKKQGELEQLTDYILGLTSSSEEEEVGMTLEEAIQEVKAAFAEENINYLALAHLGDSEYRLFTIQGGQVGGIDFQANYDRVTGIVYELQVEGEAFSAGVKLENLYHTLLEAVSEQEEEIAQPDLVDEDTDTELTLAEQFAIDQVYTSLVAETDLVYDKDDISIIDLDENLFHIVVTVGGDTGIVVEFDYELTTRIAKNIVGDHQGDLFVVSGTMAVSEMPSEVLDAWELEFSE